MNLLIGYPELRALKANAIAKVKSTSVVDCSEKFSQEIHLKLRDSLQNFRFADSYNHF